MEKDKLIQRLMATFLGELEDHVRTLNGDLLALEKGVGPEEHDRRLTTLFRTAHSLKGAARSVSVRPIEEACHALEELLSRLREGQLSWSSELFALLFEAADALAEAGKRLREQSDLRGAKLEELSPRLRGLIGTRSVPPAGPGLPRAPESSVPSEPGDLSSVRVQAERLDALLRRSSELLVARRRSELRSGEIGALEEFVGNWQDDWKRSRKALRDVLRPTDRTGAGSGSDAAAAALAVRSLPQVLEKADENLRKLAVDLERLKAAVAADYRILEQTAAPLDEGLRKLRMLPFAQACEGLDRAVRDLAKSGGKEFAFRLEGGGVELDRSILERLKDPLLHLVRNAADHGLEAPEERRKAGKPAQGKLTVQAALQGSRVEISVEDDGRGLDLARIREQARKRKIDVPEDPEALARLIFMPGFSTSPLITEVSGRGVGLDVVKSRVESLHGTVSFSFQPGRGTRFALTVPLTLSTVRVLLVGAAGQVYAIVGTSVKKLVRAGIGDLGQAQGREVFLHGGSPIPVVSLAEMLGLRGGELRRASGKVPAVVVTAGDREAALVVDDVQAEQEVVVKTLGPRLGGLRTAVGATILASGKVVLLLSAGELVDRALGSGARGTLAASLAEPAPVARKRLLVVDDSVTTRSLERSILESAGYEVQAAVDGQEAWQILQEKGADLIIADVEMPRMDGFTLAQTIRSSKRFGDLPVVLVTALGSERDKARGIEVGADAYLVKSAFDQKSLLETVERLL
ncbi:MAG TPA: hybrid sensor histidine kinase/response regulator [Planctomycetota bacterium]|nr:hybrid sensor histidine kinase/response regulator [Planctomycetota bacterium]